MKTKKIILITFGYIRKIKLDEWASLSDERTSE
jgi:hypothetical protein